MSRAGLIIACGLCVSLMPGCVERRIKITSQPSGALVHLNDEEVGRTPLEVPFTYYGVYDVRLEAAGHELLWVKQKTQMPWWEAMGPDLFAEAIPNNKVELEWHFDMREAPPPGEVDVDALKARARQLQQRNSEGRAEGPAVQSVGE